MNLFTELKRRNVFRVGLAYVLMGWVLLQGADFVLDLIGAPEWFIRGLAVVVIVGLPIALFFAWAFELTPEGVKRESEVDRSRSIAPQTGRKLDYAIFAFLAIAVVLLLANRFYPEAGPSAPPSTGMIDESAQEGDTVTNASEADQAPSIAVLPFVNMSADPDQEYFSDGLAEELLNRLAQTTGLRVAARTSAFQFKGQNLDVSDIGRQLKVNHVLEGSVRKSGNRLRVTAQLIKVEDGYHLWSETYEREMDDVFAIQDDISTAITTALETHLGMAAEAQADHPPTENLEAYEHYLQARYLLAHRGTGNLMRSRELFEQAVALDPAFERAWSGLAYCYSVLPSYNREFPVNDAVAAGIAAARRAIELNPDNAEAYTALGRFQAHYQRQFMAARLNFEKAYELAPRDADVVNLYGDFLVIIGDFERAETIERLAVELDPLAAVQYSDLAILYLILRRNDEALKAAQNSARLEPTLPVRQAPMVSALIETGDLEEAERQIRRLEDELGADASFIGSLGAQLAMKRGDRETVRRLLAEYAGPDDESLWAATEIAFFKAWTDGVTAALPLLQRAYEREEYGLSWPELFYLPEAVSSDPAWLEFWQQPGLAELIALRRANHPDPRIGYWKDPP